MSNRKANRIGEKPSLQDPWMSSFELGSSLSPFPGARHIIGRIMYGSIGNMTLRKTSAVVSMQLCRAGLMAKFECMAWAGHCESVRLSPCDLDQTLHLTLGTANLCGGNDQTIAPGLPNPAVLGSWRTLPLQNIVKVL